MTNTVQRALPPRPAGPPAGPGGGGVAVRETRHYVDDTDRMRTAAIKVPVNDYGKPVSTWMRCTRCTPRDRWVPNAIASRGDPVCDVHDRVMVRVPIPKAPLLPWSGIVAALRPYLWLWTVDRSPEGRRTIEVVAGSPGWLALVALAGFAAAHDRTPPPVWAVAGLGLALFAARMVGRRLTTRAKARGKLDDDPETGLRHRIAISSVARTVAYGITAAGLWVTAAGFAGVDPEALGGRIVWTVLAVLWVVYASTYWRWVRQRRARREGPPPPTVEVIDPMEPTEAMVMFVWDTKVSVKQGQMVPAQPPAGTPAVDGKRG